MTMSKIVLAILITVLGIVVWLALAAKFKAWGIGRRFLELWRENSGIREATICGSALIVSCVLFTILPTLLL
jgi:hypothetical protein